MIRRLGYPFVVAAGDDRTDEDLFRAVNGLSLRVAPRGPTRARYVLAAQKDVPLLLKRLEEALHENGR